METIAVSFQYKFIPHSAIAITRSQKLLSPRHTSSNQLSFPGLRTCHIFLDFVPQLGGCLGRLPNPLERSFANAMHHQGRIGVGMFQEIADSRNRLGSIR